MIIENEDTNDPNKGNDENNDQGEATENEFENLVKILQGNVSLSFGNVEEISEEEKIINFESSELRKDGK